MGTNDLNRRERALADALARLLQAYPDVVADHARRLEDDGGPTARSHELGERCAAAAQDAAAAWSQAVDEPLTLTQAPAAGRSRPRRA